MFNLVSPTHEELIHVIDKVNTCNFKKNCSFEARNSTQDVFCIKQDSEIIWVFNKVNKDIMFFWDLLESEKEKVILSLDF